MNHQREAQLIGLDWGTSSLRAYLLGRAGRVLQDRSLPLGIMRLLGNPAESPREREQVFEAAFNEACGDWIESSSSAPVIAYGMIGSAQGWREAPYLAFPLNLQLLAKSLTPILLIGESALCARYQRALNLHGYQDVTIATNATEHGLWNVAVGTRREEVSQVAEILMERVSHN